MARRLFGGTPADVAERTDGSRIPGAVGTVYTHGTDDIETDLTDLQGNAMAQLTADSRGVVLGFYGPNNAEGEPEVDTLDVDFGEGRVTLRAAVPGAVMSNRINVVNQPGNGKPWLAMKTVDGSENPAVIIGPALGLGVLISNRGNLTASKTGANSAVPALTVQTNGQGGAAETDKLASFRNTSNLASFVEIYADGSMTVTGQITTTKQVLAPNVGTARVFSGAVEPTDPKTGDVWVRV